MAWKNLQQTTLVDAMLIEHEALNVKQRRKIAINTGETASKLIL